MEQATAHPSAPEYFHVQTQLPSGTWQTFSSVPIEGLQAAEAQLDKVKEFAVETGNDPERVRLHKLTAYDMAVALPPDERDRMLAWLIDALGPAQFLAHLTEMRFKAHETNAWPTWFRSS